MRDSKKHEAKTIKIHTDGNAGPYITAPLSQKKSIVEKLKQAKIYCEDSEEAEEAIRLDGAPKYATINLGNNANVDQVKKILGIE